MLSIRKLVVLVGQEAWEHGLFEAAEDQKERACFDDSCDPARPAPAVGVRNGTAGNEPETVIGSISAIVT